MNIKPIKTAKDHNNALERIDALWEAKVNTPEGDELDILITLVCVYKEQHHSIDAPNPVEAIKFKMDQANLKPADLVKYLGQRSRVTEVLNYKRKLSLTMIRNLSNGLNIPLSSLVKEYVLKKRAI